MGGPSAVSSVRSAPVSPSRLRRNTPPRSSSMPGDGSRAPPRAGRSLRTLSIFRLVAPDRESGSTIPTVVDDRGSEEKIGPMSPRLASVLALTLTLTLALALTLPRPARADEPPLVHPIWSQLPDAPDPGVVRRQFTDATALYHLGPVEVIDVPAPPPTR